MPIKTILDAITLPSCNPSTQEAEAGGSQVQGQPVLHSKTLSQNKIKDTITLPPSPSLPLSSITIIENYHNPKCRLGSRAILFFTYS
jgi:hypothetical protein